MLNVVKKGFSSHKILKDSQVLVKVMHANDLESIAWNDTDGIVICTLQEEHALEIVHRIRRHENLRISMSPIFVDSGISIAKEILVHTDGSIDLGSNSLNLTNVGVINKRLQQLPSRDIASSAEIPLIKLLSFLYTRNQVLLPFTSRSSLIGYYFPILQLFFKPEEVIALMGVMESGEREGYLQKKCLDHIHLCKSCHGSFLNFREICPQCSSIDISANDMVHHFVCAHVAPEKDFITEEGLQCPKCDKTLRHIGIDYDKPSSVFQCNTCTHEFQNPGMHGFCYDCNSENQLSELLQKTIGSYSITARGEDWLLKAECQPNKNPAKEESIGLGESVFRLLVQQELQRVKNNKTHSIVGSISFSDEQLDLLNDDLKKSLRLEIGNIIKSYLNPADVLSGVSYNNYFFLLPDTLEEFPERLDVIQYNLSKLLSDNLREEKLDIAISTKQLSEFSSVGDIFSFL